MYSAPKSHPTSKTVENEQDIRAAQVVDEITSSLDLVKVDEDQTIYFGGAHWISIMSEVCIDEVLKYP